MKTKTDILRLERVKRRLRFDGCFIVNILGRKGGLALLWKFKSEVEIKSFSQRHISAMVEDSRNNTSWLFTGLYDEFETGKHYTTWNLLQDLQLGDATLWLVMSDFNEVMYSSKKVGGRLRKEKHI